MQSPGVHYNVETVISNETPAWNLGKRAEIKNHMPCVYKYIYCEDGSKKNRQGMKLYQIRETAGK